MEQPEQDNEKDCSQCIGDIVAYNASLQFTHWRADTITNEHKAIGDLYTSMSSLIDEFAESYMGKYDVISYPPMNPVDLGKKPVSKGWECVQALRDELDDDDEDLLNIVADMENALNKAAYLLKEK